MIKFAVTRPNDRMTSIQHGIKMLSWGEDKYLKNFGIKVDPNLTLVSSPFLISRIFVLTFPDQGKVTCEP